MNSAIPNIIGNVEDNLAPQFISTQPFPPLNAVNNERSMPVDVESSNFKDITPGLIRSKRSKSKARL